MNVNQFKRLADKLFLMHYGIGINDTRLADLTDDDIVKGFIKRGAAVFEAVNFVAEKDGLELLTSYGMPWVTELTMADQRAAMVSCDGVIEVSDEPVMSEPAPRCPVCESWTSYTKFNDTHQHHVCPNTTCGHEFVIEDVYAISH